MPLPHSVPRGAKELWYPRPSHAICRRIAGFHSSTARRDDTSFPDHYATLELQPTATAAEIKKQFYHLSKRHHPDHQPPSTRSSASTRFIAINDAYHILRSASTRQKYDRDYARVHGSSPAQYRSGSHYGGQKSQQQQQQQGGPAGSRPASGLSRRRSPFRGPPPSYYQWGGRDASMGGGGGGPTTAGSASSSSSSAAGGASAGTREGQDPKTQFYEPDPDLPYWDRAAHFRTHEGIRMRRERGGEKQKGEETPEYEGGSTGMNFLVVGALVAVSTGIPVYLLQRLFFGG